MNNRNEFIIEGTIVEDAELTGQKSNIVTFTINNIQRQKNKATGDWEDAANMLTFNVWGGMKQEDVYDLQSKCHKGAEVIIFGTLVNDDYQNNQGKLVTRTKLQVWKDGIVFKAVEQDDISAVEQELKDQFKKPEPVQKEMFGSNGPETFEDSEIPF